jgi:hypothetical protein
MFHLHRVSCESKNQPGPLSGHESGYTIIWTWWLAIYWTDVVHLLLYPMQLPPSAFPLLTVTSPLNIQLILVSFLGLL